MNLEQVLTWRKAYLTSLRCDPADIDEWAKQARARWKVLNEK